MESLQAQVWKRIQLSFNLMSKERERYRKEFPQVAKTGKESLSWYWIAKREQSPEKSLTLSPACLSKEEDEAIAEPTNQRKECTGRGWGGTRGYRLQNSQSTWGSRSPIRQNEHPSVSCCHSFGTTSWFQTPWKHREKSYKMRRLSILPLLFPCLSRSDLPPWTPAGQTLDPAVVKHLGLKAGTTTARMEVCIHTKQKGTFPKVSSHPTEENASTFQMRHSVKVGFPAPTRHLTTVYSSSSRGSDARFWPLWAPRTHIVWAYMQAKCS